MKLIHRIAAPVTEVTPEPPLFTTMGHVTKMAGGVRKFLSALNWKQGLSVWCEIDPTAQEGGADVLSLWAIPTGSIALYVPRNASFIGTVLFPELGMLVFHIYGLAETEDEFNVRHPFPETRPVPE